MARSLFSDLLLDRRGNALSNVSVTVYDEGTTTPISETIFSTRTGATTLANPFTASGGEVRFWLDVAAERVDVKYSGVAITTKTVTLDGVSPDDLGGGGVTDHGALTGLADDDHSAYPTTAEAQVLVDAHSTDTTSVHGITDTTVLATDAEITTAVSNHEAAANPHATYETSAEAQAKVDVHTADASDAHDASAISFVPAGTIAATNVQAAVEEVASEAGGSTRELKSFTYIAQGTTTYTLPAGITAIYVECIGGGGGGAGVATNTGNAALGSGGAGGGYAAKWIPSPAASYACVVGAGGAGGAAGQNDGNTGGTTTFDSPSICTATGGTLGNSMVVGTSLFLSADAAGGAGTVGDLLLKGGPGGGGIRLSGTVGRGGYGGFSARGGGGGRGPAGALAGPEGGDFGGGGAGGVMLNNSGAVAGGNGANGRIIVHEYGPA